MVRIAIIVTSTAILLCACGTRDDATWVAPMQACNYEVSSTNGILEIKHDYCASEVTLLNTVNMPKCITCEPWEMNPRSDDARNDAARMK